MNQAAWSEMVSLWKKDFPNIIESNVNIVDFTQQFPILKLAEPNRIFFTIFKLSDLSLEYYSENIEDVLGIPLEVFAAEKTNAFYKKIPPEHLKGVLATLEYTKQYYASLKSKKQVSENMTYRCGLKFNHAEKGVIKLFWRSQIFEIDDLLNPQRIILMVQDVTHLIKNDFFWFRAELKSETETTYFTSRSDTEGYSKNDILSDREKEILSYFATGKSSDEIAKILFISKATVNNHRQNMLNKIGARDLTALIQLAKMTKII